MTRKPVFWVVSALIFIGSVIFTLKFFPSAYPIVNLDLKMNREAALKSARDLAEQFNWGPEKFKQAATFGVDTEVQNYVELETGGPESFAKMLKQGLYFPYTWSVRHFRENETNETLVRFTPSGQPYGFIEKLPEEAPGPGLNSQSALKIAETEAVVKWGINLTSYKLVEKSQEIRPGKRIDHTFVYERPDVQIGQGLYRLRLVVSGDKLTELTHFVKIPEAFMRHYQEMRSANETIANLAMVAAAILYIIGGCIVGLFLLLKQRWVLWRKAVFWGFFIAFLLVLVQINYMPLAWMDYDTALSAQGFLLQQVVQMLVTFIGMGLLLTLSFMTAESLTRKAFPNHIQFWKLWSTNTANSPAVLGRTVGGYLAVGLFFVLDVVFYFFVTKVLGWWTPSESLFEPDILATYFPWLTSIAYSLQAGFWEECLFRAIPIAGAALIGQRLGHRRAWIIGAFFVQALVFGSGHANYPQQPAYARIVELIIPSIGWGLIYIYFGLLPAIILHFTVDVVYFSIPLFVSSAPGIWVDRAMVIVLTFIPLFIIVYKRIRAKQWQTVPEENYNRSWKPPQKVMSVTSGNKSEKRPPLSLKKCRVVLIGGVLGLAVWFLASSFNNIAPSLTMSRTDAEKLARTTMDNHGIALSDSWQLLSAVEAPMGEDDRFIWQNEGEEKYQELLGSFVPIPAWRLRFVQFEGDVAERAEEFQILTAQPEEIIRFLHILPESRPGADLTEESARRIAYSFLAEKFQLDASKLKEVSAEPSKLPEREDWLFTFADTLNHPLKEGEARIAVKISGDEVTDVYRYIHVPEEWERQERNRNNLTRIVQIFVILVIFALFVAGVIGASIQWSRKHFSVSVFLIFMILSFVIGLINLVNRWPATIAQFSTAEPLMNQKLIAIIFPIVGLIFLSAAIALIIGFVTAWKTKQTQSQGTVMTIGTGFALGIIIASLSAVISMWFKPSLEPLWADYKALSSFIPILKDGIGSITSYILGATILMLIITSIDRFSNGWTKRKAVFGILLVLMIFVISGNTKENLSFWFISGLTSGIFYLLAYLFVLRFNIALIPLTVGAGAMLDALRQGLMHAYPTAVPGAVLAIILIGVLSVFWYKLLSQ